jgi:DNA-binding CsgD family transcriptional regulator
MTGRSSNFVYRDDSYPNATTTMESVTPQTLALIGRIYDACLSSDQWPSILDEVAECHGAMSSVLFYHDSCHPEFLPGLMEYSSFWHQDVLQDYLAEVHEEEPSARLLRDTEARTIITSESIPLKEKMRIAGYALKMWRKFGIRALAAARLNDSAAWFDYVALQFDSAHGPLRPDEARSLQLVLPHLAKAMEISRPLSLLEKRFNAVLGALDRFQVGVIVLSANGRKVLANAAAQSLLDMADGMSLDPSGRLRLIDSTAQARLAHAIEEASATARAEGTRPGALVTVPRRSGRDAFLLEIAPLTDAGSEIGAGFAGCILYMIDPSQPPRVSTDGIQQIFGLSDAEAAVCRLLIDGHTNAEIADIRGVSTETIKSQLKSLMNKTGVEGRVQLVRLALSVNLPVDPW